MQKQVQDLIKLFEIKPGEIFENCGAMYQIYFTKYLCSILDMLLQILNKNWTGAKRGNWTRETWIRNNEYGRKVSVS